MSLIIAEIGTSHEGSLEKARLLVDAAADSGADAIKFQWVYADEILHPKTGFVKLPTGNIPLYERFRQLECPVDFYRQMIDYVHSKGCKFCCSPFGLRSLKELLSLKPDILKVASPELNHYPMLKEIARYRKEQVARGETPVPVVLSSGVSKMEDIRKACDEFDLKLYLDGARLAYGLASPENDLTLPDIARLCDAFYIGGTKCGALFGEAVVFPKPGTVPHFFMITKQMGALLAKGRIPGVMFDALFTDGLYDSLGKAAVAASQRIQDALEEKGYELLFRSPTNQIFVIMRDEQFRQLLEKVDFEFWEKYDEDHTVVRFVTSWSTQKEEVDRLIDLL